MPSATVTLLLRALGLPMTMGPWRWCLMACCSGTGDSSDAIEDGVVTVCGGDMGALALLLVLWVVPLGL